MEGKAPPPLLFLLPLLLSYICTTTTSAAAAAAVLSPTPTPSPSSPDVASPPFHGGGSPSSSTLDPKQLTALQSMGLPTAHDPCAQPSPHDNATACDAATPFRHLLSLRLANCSPDLDLSPTALRSLSTLRSLSFLRCPIPPPRRLPPSLTSFSCAASLHRLSGVWLSRLRNLTDLSVTDVPISASAPWVIISTMPHLRSLTLARTNLSGGVPHHWHPLGLTAIDLSGNRLTGTIPSSIGVLSSLASLNLTSNALAGVIPDGFGDAAALKIVSLSQNSLSGPIPEVLSGLSALAHLDLSSNQFNGSIPRFLSEMTELRVLNLENNNLHGALPFNASFIKGMAVFKVGGNAGLCYNRTVLSSKMRLGIAPCDRYGLPVSPPPDRPARGATSDDDGGDEDGGDDDGGERRGGGGHHGPSKPVLGVAIALSCLAFLVIFCVCVSKVRG